MYILFLLSLLLGWLLDLLFGDPACLPHPVIAFGRWISFWEHRLNRGRNRKLKGAIVTVGSILLVFFLTWLVLWLFCQPAWCIDIPLLGLACSPLAFLFSVLLVFFFLAGHTLRKEVRDVFLALDRSLDEGRRQVARIVGRDTANLSAQEVRTAALETLAENLSDGVVAPLFWFAILGLPGMAAYKMVNTLDSMIGYRTERYRDFGCWAAHIDDIANYIPARLSALLILSSYQFHLHFRPSHPASASLDASNSCSRPASASSGTSNSSSTSEEAPAGTSISSSTSEEAPAGTSISSSTSEEAPSGTSFSSFPAAEAPVCTSVSCSRPRFRSARQLLAFVLRYGPCHASPNSGWPEAALAACLDCQFGGTHDYFGQPVVKPLIGDNPRSLTTADLHLSLRLAFLSELLALLLVVALALLLVLLVI